MDLTPIITALDYLQSLPALYISGVGLLGLCIGSFLNVVIYRLPRMLEGEWRAQALEILQTSPKTDARETKHYNLCLPRSHCPHCNQTIKAIHNIPVLSYLWLRGRCAYCKHAISMRYPLIEMLSAVIAVFLAWHYGLTGMMLTALIFSWSLLCLVVIDLDHLILPDNISLPLLWLGLFLNVFGLWTDSHSAIMGAIAGYLSLWSITWVFHRVTGKIGMGHGDFKLLAVFGAWFGWQVLPLIILLASLVGAIVGIGLMLFRNHHRDTPIPFGPYLALAGWIAMLWGHPIMGWYWSLN
jgi:leader peptidase (prepilin peptidase) / N-methyltransferase